MEQDNNQDSQTMDSPAAAQATSVRPASLWAPRVGGPRFTHGRSALFGHLDASRAGTQADAGYLLAVGIDRLGFFNETLGTATADALIAATEARLRQILGPVAAVQRVGGDVFAVFMRGAPAGEMSAVAAHILTNFQDAPMSVGGGLVRVSVSIGGVASEAAANPALLLSRAESALRTAKDGGRGRFAPYAASSAQILAYGQTLEIGDTFLRALKDRRLGLAFQQVVDSRTGKVSFHECLIRLIGEDGRVRRAAEFMPAVEELGLVRMLDQAAITMAIRELATFPDLVLSANVSHDSLADMTWLRGVVGALRDRPDIARRLVVEITESAVMHDTAQVQRIVRTLKDLGCRVALDDFGAGYTAFAQIQSLNVDIVKIDQSFVRRMREEGGHLFIRALQTLADGMDIETVGEGAETAEEVQILVRDGVRHIQGYVHGMPVMERLWLPPGHVNRRFADNLAA